MNNEDLPTPPHIANTADTSSSEHLYACLAWELMRKLTAERLQKFLLKQPKPKQKKLGPHLAMARAWIWLHKLSNREIRDFLPHIEPQEREVMRSALNELRPHLKRAENNE